MNIASILKSPYTAPFFALALSAGLLIGAWISQYGFGYYPCTMCYWQRHVHKAVVVVAALALLSTRLGLPIRQVLTLMLILLFLGSAGLAFYHSGVEFKWWEGPQTCSAGVVGDLTDFKGENLFDQLDQNFKPPSCSEAVWFFLGLSMASWNGILSLCGAIGTALLMKKAAS
jgi:disulfide bond formation protein DsbB